MCHILDAGMLMAPRAGCEFQEMSLKEGVMLFFGPLLFLWLEWGQHAWSWYSHGGRAGAGDSTAAGKKKVPGLSRPSITPSDCSHVRQEKKLRFAQAAVTWYFLSLISEPNPDWHRAQKLPRFFLCCDSSLKIHTVYRKLWTSWNCVLNLVCVHVLFKKRPMATHLTLQILSFLIWNKGRTPLTSAELILGVDATVYRV